VSDIPFVDRLGDAFEEAIVRPEAARARRSRRWRRVAAVALACVMLGAGGAGVAGIVGDPEELAVNNVACYGSDPRDAPFAILSSVGRSATETCAALWSARGRAAPPLVECAKDAAAAVIPGRGAESCRRHGFEPVPAGYAIAEDRFRHLTQDIATIEESADCIPPAELARRVQALLDRSGWPGWRTVVDAADQAPCGWLRQPGGAPPLSLGSAVRLDRSELVVTTGPPRSLHRLLFGQGSVVSRLVAASGERCFTLSELRQRARSELDVTGRSIRFKVNDLPENTGIEPPRGERYAEGCAIAVGAYPIYPAQDVVAVEVEIMYKGG